MGRLCVGVSALSSAAEVVIGLTILAYRYEGLRREDFDEVLGCLDALFAVGMVWDICS